MSTLINRINRIKRLCSLEWLTPSQTHTWHALQERLALNDVVNLHGPPGSGKTFLAWLLVKHLDQVTYLPVFTTLPENTSKNSLLIIDNYTATRDTYRTLLKHLSFSKHAHTLVITQTPIPDYCYRVPLALTATDVDHVYQQLLTIDAALPPSRGGTLHHLLNPDLPLP